MTYDDARAILDAVIAEQREYIDTDTLFNTYGHADADDRITLEGNFTADVLEAIAVVMRYHHQHPR